MLPTSGDLRAQVSLLLQAARDGAPDVKRRLAKRARALAQLAEAIERSDQIDERHREVITTADGRGGSE